MGCGVSRNLIGDQSSIVVKKRLVHLSIDHTTSVLPCKNTDIPAASAPSIENSPDRWSTQGRATVDADESPEILDDRGDFEYLVNKPHLDPLGTVDQWLDSDSTVAKCLQRESFNLSSDGVLIGDNLSVAEDLAIDVCPTESHHSYECDSRGANLSLELLANSEANSYSSPRKESPIQTWLSNDTSSPTVLIEKTSGTEVETVMSDAISEDGSDSESQAADNTSKGKKPVADSEVEFEAIVRPVMNALDEYVKNLEENCQQHELEKSHEGVSSTGDDGHLSYPSSSADTCTLCTSF